MNYESQFFLSKEIKRLFICPIVFTVHFLAGEFSYFYKGYSYERNKLLSDNQVLKNILDFSTSIICVTRFSYKMVTEVFGIPTNKVSIIYNGNCEINKLISESLKNQIKEALGFKANERIILYAGRLENRKGIDKLISSYLKLTIKIADMKLVIAGDGDFQKYFSYAIESPGKICFTGKIEKEKMYLFYQIAEAGIIPSRYEQCSYVAIEMMQHGLPLIISDVPGLNELIEHEVNGLICKVVANTKTKILEPDEEDLLLQIKRILNDTELRDKIKQNALEIAKLKFACITMGKKSLLIYKKILNDTEVEYKTTNSNNMISI